MHNYSENRLVVEETKRIFPVQKILSSYSLTSFPEKLSAFSSCLGAKAASFIDKNCKKIRT